MVYSQSSVNSFKDFYQVNKSKEIQFSPIKELLSYRSATTNERSYELANF